MPLTSEERRFHKLLSRDNCSPSLFSQSVMIFRLSKLADPDTTEETPKAKRAPVLVLLSYSFNFPISLLRFPPSRSQGRALTSLVTKRASSQFRPLIWERDRRVAGRGGGG